MSDKRAHPNRSALIGAVAALIGASFGSYVTDFAALRQVKVDEFERVASTRGAAYADVSAATAKVIEAGRSLVQNAADANSRAGLTSELDAASDAVARLEILVGSYVLPSLQTVKRQLTAIHRALAATPAQLSMTHVDRLDAARTHFVARARRDIRSFLDKS